MKIRLSISALIAALFIISLELYVNDLNIVAEFYAKNIRGSLFTGFLTMGSFLLSLKTFIVVKLKENIFDSQKYKDELENSKKLNPNLTLYGPVKRLSQLLFISIISAIGTSILQLTIGLIQKWPATLFCLFFAAFTLSMLIATLLLIKGILDVWLDRSEQMYSDSKKT